MGLSILRVMAEGSRVCIYRKTRMVGAIHLQFEAMDRLRIEDGRIAGHWDVIQGRGLLSSLLSIVSGSRRRR